jgi:hypothetical protein
VGALEIASSLVGVINVQYLKKDRLFSARWVFNPPMSPLIENPDTVALRIFRDVCQSDGIPIAE